MPLDVRGLRHNFKVFRGVVGYVAVDVMDNLCRQ